MLEVLGDDVVLEVGIRCEWIGDKSFAFSYEIRERGTQRLVAEATSIQVCYDYEAKRSIRMPEELRRALESFEGRSLARTAEGRSHEARR